MTKEMWTIVSGDKLWLVVGWLVGMVAFGYGAVAGSAALFQAVGPSHYAWSWLRLFGVPRTEETCISFARGVCIVAMVIGTVIVVSVLLVGKGD